MPTYAVTAPNGKTLKITGDHVPTAAELQDIFTKAGVSTGAATPSAAAEPSAFARAASQFYEKSPIGPVVGLAKGTAAAVGLTGEGFHPLDAAWDAVKGQAKAHWDQAVTAAQKVKAAAHAAQGGNGMEASLSATEAIGHGLAAILPLFGPVAADIGEHGARGDIAGMAGGAAGLLIPFAAKYGLERAKAPNPARADLLTREAEQQVAQRVLAPGNPRYKGTAQALAPSVLERKLAGTRLELQQLADEGMDAAGSQIDRTVSAHGGPQAPVATAPIVQAMTARIDELMVNGAPIPTAAARVESLTTLRDYIQKLGPTVDFSAIKAIRDDFYGEAAKHGGYQSAGQAQLADAAWAAREGGSAIREALALDRPDTAAHYAEYTFWKNLNDVLDPTIGRPKSNAVTTGATGGLHTTGAIIGAGLSHVPGVQAASALVFSKLLPAIRQAVSSPEWQLASASKKMALAEAIKNGQMGRTQGLLLQIAKTVPRQVVPVPIAATATDEDTSPPTGARR